MTFSEFDNEEFVLSDLFQRWGDIAETPLEVVTKSVCIPEGMIFYLDYKYGE